MPYLNWLPLVIKLKVPYFIFIYNILLFYLGNPALLENVTLPINVNPPNLDILNQAKNIHKVPTSSPVKILGKSVNGFLRYDRTNKQTNRDYYFIYILAWEPSAAQVTKSYSSRLPAPGRFYWKTKFSLLKSTHSVKNLKTKLKTFPWLSRVPQSKFEGNRSRGS